MGRRLEQYSLYRLVAALLVLATSTLAAFLGASPTRWEALFGVSAFSLATLIGTLLWARRDPGRVVAYVVLAIDAVVTTAIVAVSGGATSLATVLFGAMIAGGAFLEGRPGAAVATALSALGFGAVAVFAPQIVDAPVYAFTAPISTIFGFLLLGVLTPTLFASARKEERALSERILEAIRSGVLSVDAQGVIRDANPAAEVLLGQVIGRSVDEVFTAWGGDLPWEESIDGRRFFCSSAPLPGRGRVVVVDDVTEIMAMRERSARDERFVVVGQIAARVAHEIRNPLAALSGALQVVRGQPSTRLVDLALGECERLNRLVDEVLDATRPQIARREWVELRGLADAVAEAFAQDARFRGRVSLRVAGEDVRISADPDRIRQVLWNLVLNGAQAMPRGGAVEIEVAAVAGDSGQMPGARISVSDEGVGIDPAEAERLFDPFQSRRTGGLGLGLMVVDQVVRAHGGSIAVLSCVGGGTEFRIWIPREAGVAV